MDVKEMDVKKSQRFSFGISLHPYAVVSSCSPRTSPCTPATSHNSNEIYYCFRCLLSFWPFGSVAIELNFKMVSLVRQSIMFPYWGERRLKELEAVSVISRTGWCMRGSGLTLQSSWWLRHHSDTLLRLETPNERHVQWDTSLGTNKSF